jgi:hypothetical protein
MREKIYIQFCGWMLSIMLNRTSDVEQVAEAYMLKRDHPKFKGN